MPYPIEKKLVVGVSSNALFDLQVEDEIYKEQGLKAYKEYQTDNRTVILGKGLAYPFIRRFLSINKLFPNKQPVEVVVLSKNSPETGLRVFNSICEYKLDISRAAFTSGKSPYEYIPAFNISLFLSTDENDVKNAINKNYPAGRILKTSIRDNEEDTELRLAFDFDGVLADDSAEQYYQECKDLDKYFEHETAYSSKPLEAGLLLGFLQKVSFFQKLEDKALEQDPEYKKVLRTAIITARNAPAHERAVNTLKYWDVNVDEMFFLGGIEKRRILEILKPHLFIDDQIFHLDESLSDIPLVHIPFGVINREKVE
ncbi:5'-nucleotidase [Oscillospiraceae bacterium CM]|nr:5'-nucleotidase [Oscillospiraceae bacterium CM]